MPDLTYTAQGTFDQNGNVIINICVPKEPAGNTYKTELYNLSKITASGSINVILCHFSNGSSTTLQHNSGDYLLQLNCNTLTNHSGVVDFDENKDEAIFLFFHEEIFQRSDRDYFFQNMELILELVKQQGNHNVTIPFSSSFAADNPRKLGVSLVRKLIR